MVIARNRRRLASVDAVRAAGAAGVVAAVALAALPAQAAYVAESGDALHTATAALRDRLAATGEVGSFVVTAGEGMQAADVDALVPTIATPAPEPETYALMLAGLGVVGWAARRRRKN